jgi:hypothetical protein
VFLINHRFICLPCTVESGQIYNPATFQCTTCGLSSFLNASSLTCQPISCPAATPRFNRQLLICEKCPPGLVVDQSDLSICINPKTIHLCNPTAPYYIDYLGRCSICPAGTVFNNGSHNVTKPKANVTANVTVNVTANITKVHAPKIVNKTALRPANVTVPRVSNVTVRNVSNATTHKPVSVPHK